MFLYKIHARAHKIMTRGRVLIMVANVQERITSTPRQDNTLLPSVMGRRLDRRQHRHREAIAENCTARYVASRVARLADMASSYFIGRFLVTLWSSCPSIKCRHGKFPNVGGQSLWPAVRKIN